MKLFSYLRYFFYLSWHWNPWLAFFVIRYEWYGEKKYHIDTIGANELTSLEEKGIDISHATMYMPVNYFILEMLMDKIIAINNTRNLLDLGSGKGRVLIVAAAYGFKKITGVDFSKEFCDYTAKLTAACKKENPSVQFKIINNDAFYYDIPADVSVIFLFNPFDEVIMSGVVSNIIRSQEHNPRTIHVLYANAQHKELFIESGFTEIFRVKKLRYIEGCILEKKPGSQP